MHHFLEGVSQAYGEYNVSTGVSCDTHLLPLDRCSVSGQLHLWSLLTSSKFEFLVPVWSLADSNKLCDYVDHTTVERSLRQVVSGKWEGHLATMNEDGILETAELDHLQFCSGYFARPKSDGLSARTIFNGRRMSRCFKPPPPVNICSGPEIAALISRLVDELGPGDWLIGDLRHWYHQIPLDESVRNWFGMRTADTAYRFRVLPMGWSYSCALAQRITMAILLHTMSGESRLGSTCRQDAANPPPYVVLEHDGKRVGVLACLYDNILIFCTHRPLAEQWHARVLRNMALFNATLKEWRHVKWEDMAASDISILKSGPSTNVVHLGAQYAYIKSRRRCRLAWRHPPEKAQKMVARAEQLTKTPSPADVAQVVGYILWDAALRGVPLADREDAIDVLKRVARYVHHDPTKPKWHTPGYELSERDRETLKNRMEPIRVNEWCTLRSLKRTSQRRVLAASDASSEALGWCILSSAGGVEMYDWIEGDLDDIMFIREMRAAELALRTAMTEHERRPIDIYLCIDATAVVGALRVGYSTNKQGNMILRRINSYRREYGADVFIVPIRGLDNAADCPSHYRQPSQERVRRTLEVLADFMLGMIRSRKPEGVESECEIRVDYDESCLFFDDEGGENDECTEARHTCA